MSVVDKYKKSKRKASRVTVTPAKGGFVAETHYKSDEGKNNDLHNGEPEKSVHKTLNDVHKHMTSCMEPE